MTLTFSCIRPFIVSTSLTHHHMTTSISEGAGRELIPDFWQRSENHADVHRDSSVTTGAFQEPSLLLTELQKLKKTIEKIERFF